jgi:hypothetical protein
MEVKMNRNFPGTISAVALVAMVAFPGSLLAQSKDEDKSRLRAPVTIEVENGNWLDVRVYAVRENGAYDRVGTVTSGSFVRFELPRRLTSHGMQIHLIAAPIGSTRRYRSPPVMVSVGDVIEWKLTNNLALSSISVRAGM